MPVFPFPVCRSLTAALVAFGLTGPLRATESAPAHGEPPAAEAKPMAEGRPASAPSERRDPLDVVRDRLAAKLGAIKPADGADSNVVRVISKSPAPAASAASESHSEAEAHGRAAPVVDPHNAVRAEAAHTEATDAHVGMPAIRTTTAARLARPVDNTISFTPRALPATRERGAAAADGHPPEPALPAHWDYEGAGGPDGWGRLKPEYGTCATGQRQSPIDIRDGIRVNLDPVQFDYKPSAFRVIDNGHTVQVNVGAGNSIEVMGKRFELVQFHFHRPSEERINGKQFDMVVHLVHKDLDGRLAVVAVLLDRGGAQPLVQRIWDNLPLEKGDEVAAKGTIDPTSLLPTERSYYTYMGSLTTPPCSEGVLWMVMRNPVPLSSEQIGIFSRLYPMNARPIQSASGRLIKESN